MALLDECSLFPYLRRKYEFNLGPFALRCLFFGREMLQLLPKARRPCKKFALLDSDQQPEPHALVEFCVGHKICRVDLDFFI